MRTIVARWQDWTGESLEQLVLAIGEDEIIAESTFISSHEDVFAGRYRMILDGAWRTRKVSVEIFGSSKRLVLVGDGLGSWCDEAGGALPELANAIDPDLSITPFTNTLPIRRLGLEVGQSRDICTAWFSLPDLAVHRDPQRYTCLEAGRKWRYESRDSNFSRDLEVDPHGLVVTYPGLFRRVL